MQEQWWTEKRDPEREDDRALVGLYLKQISRLPLLSVEEEAEVGHKIEQSKARLESILGDHHTRDLTGERLAAYEEEQKTLWSLRDQMVRSNLRLVVFIAKRYQNQGLSLSDLIGEGNLGLIEGVVRFDFRKGFRFSSYGVWWIRQAIMKGLTDRGRLVRVPAHTLTLVRRCYVAGQYLAQEWGREPRVGELAAYLHLPVAKVTAILQIGQDTTSLDRDFADQAPLLEALCDDAVQDPFETLSREVLSQELSLALRRLSPREALVLRLRFGLPPHSKHTLDEIGTQLGVTRERVRQILVAVLGKLRGTKRLREECLPV